MRMGMYLGYTSSMVVMNSGNFYLFLVNLSIHLRQYGSYPRFLGSTYTIPHRLMVAGEAYCRSATSNNILQNF